MKKNWSKNLDFFLVYLTVIAALWSITEAYTYFTEDELKNYLGKYGVPLFYGIPFLVSVISTALRKSLTRKELNMLTSESVDPQPFSQVKKIFHNTELSDIQLCKRIKKRNKERKPTYLLRLEYDRRLKQRGL